MTGGTVRSVVAGRAVELTADGVLRGLAGVEPEAIREHFVVVGGRRFPPKQVLAVLTGLDRAEFTSHQARTVLRRLGFGASRSSSGRAAPAPAGGRSVGEQGVADVLRPFRGRFVALRGTEVLVARDRLEDVFAWLESHDRYADTVFRVPLDPTVDLGGFLS